MPTTIASLNKSRLVPRSQKRLPTVLLKIGKPSPGISRSKIVGVKGTSAKRVQKIDPS